MSRRLLSFVSIMLLAVPLLAQQATGIKPRAKADSYPTVKEQPNLTLGAEQLSPTAVRQTFASDLSKSYVVLEVGAFPKSETELSPQDFMLVERGAKTVIRPADPETISRKLSKKEQVAKDVTVTPVTGVTYTTGRRGDQYDPAYDPQYGSSRGGWTTTTGTMVNVGPTQRTPQTIDADRKTMAAELKDKQLPAGSTAKPVAGYLYFPASAKKNVQYDLEYRTGNTNVVIPLSAPSE